MVVGMPERAMGKGRFGGSHHALRGGPLAVPLPPGSGTALCSLEPLRFPALPVEISLFPPTPWLTV